MAHLPCLSLSTSSYASSPACAHPPCLVFGGHAHHTCSPPTSLASMHPPCLPFILCVSPMRPCQHLPDLLLRFHSCAGPTGVSLVGQELTITGVQLSQYDTYAILPGNASCEAAGNGIPVVLVDADTATITLEAGQHALCYNHKPTASATGAWQLLSPRLDVAGAVAWTPATQPKPFEEFLAVFKGHALSVGDLYNVVPLAPPTAAGGASPAGAASPVGAGTASPAQSPAAPSPSPGANATSVPGPARRWGPGRRASSVCGQADVQPLQVTAEMVMDGGTTVHLPLVLPSGSFTLCYFTGSWEQVWEVRGQRRDPQGTCFAPEPQMQFPPSPPGIPDFAPCSGPYSGFSEPYYRNRQC